MQTNKRLQVYTRTQVIGWTGSRHTFAIAKRNTLR